MYKNLKRFFDIFLSLTLIFILSPLLIVTSFFIFVLDGKPIIYKSIRIGQREKKFKIYKFRSLKVNTPKNISSNDLDSNKYLTRMGPFIRRFSIDELPQIVNILKGEMSFIGPRPCIQSEKELILLRREYKVFDIKPGISGLAQVEGRDITANDVKLKAIKDSKYTKNLSFKQDLIIFFKTIVVVISGKGYKK